VEAYAGILNEVFSRVKPLAVVLMCSTCFVGLKRSCNQISPL